MNWLRWGLIFAVNVISIGGITIGIGIAEGAVFRTIIIGYVICMFGASLVILPDYSNRYKTKKKRLPKLKDYG